MEYVSRYFFHRWRVIEGSDNKMWSTIEELIKYLQETRKKDEKTLFANLEDKKTFIVSVEAIKSVYINWF